MLPQLMREAMSEEEMREALEIEEISTIKL